MATLKLLLVHSNVDAGRSISYWVGVSAFFEVAKPFRATEMTFCLALYDNEPRCGAGGRLAAHRQSRTSTHGSEGSAALKKWKFRYAVQP